MLSLFLRVAAGVFFLALVGGDAHACSCGERSTREKFRDASVVFLGEIAWVGPNRQVEDDLRVLKHPYPFVVQFKVEKQWKGARRKEITVLSAPDWRGMCGDMELATRKKYLIYASREKGRLLIHADCGPNVSAEHAGGEIKKLGSFWFRLNARLNPF